MNPENKKYDMVIDVVMGCMITANILENDYPGAIFIFLLFWFRQWYTRKQVILVKIQYGESAIQQEEV